MSDVEMLTTVDGRILAAAFPITCRSAATKAGEDAAARLTARQWTERFAVQVDGEQVLIPARLHFASEQAALPSESDAWRFARAIQTRSNDGFERQRALRDLLAEPEPRFAPFLVALIGEYIIEILEDIEAAMTPGLEHIISDFIAHNRLYWKMTKRRVTSYWNEYYRHSGRSETRLTYSRDDYVGFKLVSRIDAHG